MENYIDKRVPNISSEKILWFFPLFSIILIFLYNLTGSKILMIIGIIMMCLPVIYEPVNHLGALLYLFIPNLRMFRTLQDSQTFISLFIILSFVKMIIVWGKNRKFDYKIIISLIIYITSVLITIFIHNSYSMISSVIRFILEMFLLVSIYKDDTYNVEATYEKMINCFKLGCMISVLLGIIYKLYLGTNILMNRFGGVRNDSNIFGLTMAFAISVTLVDIIRKDKVTFNDVVLLGVLIIGGLLTFSRGFVLAVIINIILLIIIIFSKSNTTITKKIFALLILISIIIYFKDFYILVIKTFIGRFGNETIHNASGRTEIWAWYIKETLLTPMRIMFGLGGTKNILESGVYDAVQHNLYIEIFTTIGILGSFLTGVLYHNMYRIIKARFEGNDIRLISLFPLITLLISYLGLSGMYSDIQLIQFILAFATISICLKKTR